MSDRLVVESLDAFYGGAHIVQGATFSLNEGSTGLVGRNGMGKTTLCKAMVGLVGVEGAGRVTGSILLDGEQLVGRSVHRIAASGIGYVPQGRRVFASLTTHEHLKMLARRGSAWTPNRIYGLFPRLAERKNVSGARLSGGEQQMLAIGRALMTGPKILLMDEPTEGLAPAIVDELITSLATLENDEGLLALIVEQNLGAAVRLAARTLVMVNGAVVDDLASETLWTSQDLKQRYLGVATAA